MRLIDLINDAAEAGCGLNDTLLIKEGNFVRPDWKLKPGQQNGKSVIVLEPVSPLATKQESR